MKKTGYCARDFADIEKFLLSLVEKVKREDITSQEAFEVWKLFNLVNEDRIKNSDMYIEILNIWYRTVLDLLKEGRTGHFIETLPSDSVFFSGWSWQPWKEKELENVKKSFEILPEQKKQQKIQYRTDLSFENVSFTDVRRPDDKNEMRLYRCGLYDLLSGKSSSTVDPVFRTFDGKEIMHLSQKDDVTEDEADWIYDYFMWSEVQNISLIVPFDSSPLDEWFDSVQRKLIYGGYGNFITTVYIYDPDCSQESITSLLPAKDLFSRAFFFEDGKTTIIEEERAGMLKKHLPFETVLQGVYRWGRYINFPEERKEFFEGYSSLDSEIIKLEALRTVGLPFVAVEYADMSQYVELSFKITLCDILSDDDIVKETLTQKESERRMPASEALKIMIDKVMGRVIERKTIIELKTEQDESWVDIIR